MKKLIKIGSKSLLIGGISIFILVCLFQIIFVIGVSLGPEKDDIALFHGNKYVISKSPTSYDLYENNSSKILSNVTAYLVGKEKSYIANHNQLVIVDEKRGTYISKPRSEANLNEQEMISKMRKIRVAS